MEHLGGDGNVVHDESLPGPPAPGQEQNGTLLAALLTRWRGGPDPVLADVIDVVSAQVPAAPFTGALAAQAAAAVAAVASEPLPLPAILDVAGRQRAIQPAVDVLDALVARGVNDPRLTTTLVGWLRQPPWTSTGSQAIWRRVFALLQGVPDVRQRVLAELDPTQGFPGVTAAFIAGRRDRLLDRSFPAPASTDAERAGWQALLAASERVSSPAEHVARTVASLADTSDAGLAIWADALTEAGDPRGEFVRLQLDAHTLSRAGRARMGKLLSAWEAHWLGPVHDVLQKGGRVWERGLLVEASIAAPHDAAVQAALGHPTWSTVRALALRGRTHTGVRGVQLVTQPGLDALIAVRGVQDAGELREIATSEVGPRLTTVGLGGGWGAVRSLDTHPPLPAVRVLEVGPTWRGVFRNLGTAFPALEQARLLTVLSTMELNDTVFPATAIAQLDRLRRLAPVAEVRLDGPRGLALSLRTDGERVALSLADAAFDPQFWPSIQTGLAALRGRLELAACPYERRDEVLAFV